MGLENFKVAYKAGTESAKRIPTWMAMAPFFVVGIVDVVIAERKHDVGDAIVSAIVWWVAAPFWMWWTRRRQ
jgi:hypothetical protein